MEREEEDDFELWIDNLEIDVIQFEYGYEPGEFTVYPEHWRPMYDRGLTPAEAFKAGLDAHGESRREEEAARKANYQRILQQDAEAVKRWRETNP